ncbi:unnamed protein product [Thelazia callipaeda]|uniref:Ovule protein n=1 Tax=Thelazia callipaeda TaxID=103827 RepID=A0A0N5CXC4_THECL|nr:unnamed protein product [Thelazia callipaeda]
MRLFCFDLRTLMHEIFRKDLGNTSAVSNDSSSDDINFMLRERPISTISGNTLDMNYNDFVRHLQSTKDKIHINGSLHCAAVSTPVITERSNPVPIFDFPSVDRSISMCDAV